MELVIYKLKNEINGKCYVGKTSNLQKRLSGHRKKQSDCIYLNNAIQKYGFENFSIEILDKASTEDELAKKEFFHITNENTLSPYGYNLVLETNQGRIFHEDTRFKMSKSSQGRRTNKKLNFKGVRKRRLKFEARITLNDETFSKLYKTEKEAAEQYDKVAIFLFGRNAKINFPENLNLYVKQNLKSIFNSFKQKRKQTSVNKNVSFHKQSKKWRAYIYDENKKQKSLGLFKTEKEAVRAVEEKKLSKRN